MPIIAFVVFVRHIIATSVTAEKQLRDLWVCMFRCIRIFNQRKV